MPVVWKLSQIILLSYIFVGSTSTYNKCVEYTSGHVLSSYLVSSLHSGIRVGQFDGQMQSLALVDPLVSCLVKWTSPKCNGTESVLAHSVWRNKLSYWSILSQFLQALSTPFTATQLGTTYLELGTVVLRLHTILWSRTVVPHTCTRLIFLDIHINLKLYWSCRVPFVLQPYSNYNSSATNNLHTSKK